MVIINDITNVLGKTLQNYQTEILKNTDDAIKKSAEFMTDELKKATPRSDGKAKHMGDYWTSQFDSKTGKVTVYNSEKGSLTHMLEFGTNKMSPRPFINPTFNKNKQKIIDIITNNI